MTASGPAGSADESRAEGGAANGLPAGGLPADRIPAEGIPADEILSPARIAALLDARSRRLAARGQAAPETRARLRTLVCQAGAERFGLPVAAVAEVALFRPCTPVPGAPPALIGLSSRGGALLSVLDLAAALGLDAEAPEDGRWHLVVLRRDNPRIGLRWYNSAEYNSQLNGEKLRYGRLASEVRFYLSPNFPFQLTWAGRIGAARNIGDYRFYQANTLGGTTNLRGYRRTRYAGRSMTYANAEVRVQLFTFNAYLVPGKFGILGLADAGRVYSSYDVKTGFDAYHTGLGGGIWIDVLKQAVINATYSVGEESLVNVGFDFLF